MQLNIPPVEFPSHTNRMINEKIWNFVAAMKRPGQSCDHYTLHRNATKVEHDIFIGKKAEYFVGAYLAHNRGYPLVEPDTSVRHGSRKGWDYDLPYPEHPSYHVKATSYGGDLSWTFQWNDNTGDYGRDRLFRHPDDSFVACVYVESPESPIGEIKVIMPTRDVIPLLREPRLERFHGLKKCLYLSDLTGGEEFSSSLATANDVDSWFT